VPRAPSTVSAVTHRSVHSVPSVVRFAVCRSWSCAHRRCATARRSSPRAACRRCSSASSAPKLNPFAKPDHIHAAHTGVACAACGVRVRRVTSLVPSAAARHGLGGAHSGDDHWSRSADQSHTHTHARARAHTRTHTGPRATAPTRCNRFRSITPAAATTGSRCAPPGGIRMDPLWHTGCLPHCCMLSVTACSSQCYSLVGDGCMLYRAHSSFVPPPLSLLARPPYANTTDSTPQPHCGTASAYQKC